MVPTPSISFLDRHSAVDHSDLRMITVQLACTVESVCCQWDSQQRTPDYARLPLREATRYDPDPLEGLENSQVARERLAFLHLRSQCETQCGIQSRGVVSSAAGCDRAAGHDSDGSDRKLAGRELNGAQCVLCNRPGLFFLAGSPRSPLCPPLQRPDRAGRWLK